MATISPSSPLVLASKSSARAALLTRAELPFEAIPASIDERAHDSMLRELGPEGLALRLARLKAQEVAARTPGRWVLGSDQLALTDDDPPALLHQPGTHERAIEQLMRLAGRTHRLVTAFAVVGPTGETGEACDVHHMHMRDFSRAEAAAYVHAASPLHSVGAYHIEDAGIRLFERVVGEDNTAIMGLPLLRTLGVLRELGALAPAEAP